MLSAVALIILSSSEHQEHRASSEAAQHNGTPVRTQPQSHLLKQAAPLDAQDNGPAGDLQNTNADSEQDSTHMLQQTSALQSIDLERSSGLDSSHASQAGLHNKESCQEKLQALNQIHKARVQDGQRQAEEQLQACQASINRMQKEHTSVLADAQTGQDSVSQKLQECRQDESRQAQASAGMNSQLVVKKEQLQRQLDEALLALSTTQEKQAQVQHQGSIMQSKEQRQRLEAYNQACASALDKCQVGSVCVHVGNCMQSSTALLATESDLDMQCMNMHCQGVCSMRTHLCLTMLGAARHAG